MASRAVRLLADFHEAVARRARVRAGVYLSASAVPRPGSAPALERLVRAGGLTALARSLRCSIAPPVQRPAGGRRPVVDALRACSGTWRDDLRIAVMPDPAARRTWQLVDLVATNLQGMVVDGLLSGTGFDRIDHLDYREWLATHGAAAETLDSPIVRGMYDLTFAYEQGDRSRPRFAAGLGLQLAGRMLFDYKGSIFWKMQAGMGEVVFAPMYQGLAARGVEFRSSGGSHESASRTTGRSDRSSSSARPS